MMGRKTFRKPFWYGFVLLLPGAVTLGIWVYMALQIDFEIVVSSLSGAVFLPFTLFSLWLFYDYRRRKIRVDRDGIESIRGKRVERLQWSAITDFTFDLADDGRRRLLLYEVRGSDTRIRFYRRPESTEEAYEEYSTEISDPDYFSKANWSFSSRGLRISKRGMRKLRAIIEERGGKAARHYTQLLKRPMPGKEPVDEVAPTLPDNTEPEEVS